MTVNEACEIASRELGFDEKTIRMATLLSSSACREGAEMEIPAGAEQEVIEAVKTKLILMSVSPQYADRVREQIKHSPFNRNNTN